ncbi:hypothetical protein MAE02_36940 [Microvirga aerophila]|uniref:Uncharacterized protein n=1 Tax=Microvirga aerophila TaxID=670291 RepID=A0A512BVK3_9HYPH|nr:hypothetical protein MAE02_36940 [Microvirga aerophila]
MRIGFPIAICAALLSWKAEAQVNIRPEALEYYNECVNSAVQNNRVVQRRSSIVYSCRGDFARRYFNYLVNRGSPVQEVTQRNGRFIIRWLSGTQGDQSHCSHKIENADGTAASDFGCSIYAPAPPS